MLLHFGKILHPSKFSYLQIKLQGKSLPVTEKDDKKLRKINTGNPGNFARQGTGSEKTGKS